MPRLKIAAVKFQSTRPLRGATMIGHGEWLPYLFQSTRPLRGATAAGMVLSPPRPHFNPRAPCGARRDRRRGDYARADISIHAPLAGRDSGRPRWQVQAHISIHAPLAGRDCRHDFSDISASRFQSTRPLRGATIHGSHEKAGRNHFNPRAPCGARLKELQDRLTEIAFQSTRPLRGATFQGIPFGLSCKISIHAPLAGCDGQPWIFRCSTRNFNPRTPCGVRRQLLSPGVNDMPLFQSTHPLRGATVIDVVTGLTWLISIHAPLAGRDGHGLRRRCHARHFNPRAPCGARP